ncbi:hypothetical protein MICABA_02830 [Microbacterium sp. T2.11-28]|nr:hypothetical protein MICABA_02830 [Microbacterium sp. T2.11-28]
MSSGCSLARTISHELTASSATADASDAKPDAAPGQKRRADGIAPRRISAALVMP